MANVSVVSHEAFTLDDFQLTFTAGEEGPQFDIVNRDTGEVVLAGQSYESGAYISFSGIGLVITDSGSTPQAGDDLMIVTTLDENESILLDLEGSENLVIA